MNKADRNYNLDILRMMAAAFVFLVYLGQWSGYPKNAENGFYGVWLFFILSGYLILKASTSMRGSIGIMSRIIIKREL